MPPGGITLYDRPVTMSEWVDLGDASLRDNLFSRVQDQAWAKTPPPPPPPHAESTIFHPPPPPPPPPPPEPPAEPRKRRKSLKQSVKRKKSWIAGLFQQQSAEQPQPSDSNNKKKDDKKGFGSLISRSLSLSGKKKKTHQQTAQTIHNNARTASEPLLLPGHHRLPIHTERAIYRLSHIKLSNPRRPLVQQVLISNFMFWYISIQQYPFYYYQRQQLPPPPVPPPHQYAPL
ncbi:activator of mitotic machinery Cdc14 phosphatase activation C-term-domain-containing protein [Fennellomyces sp. T-0311]|nr:activator of mitotic machinery Cdc14 phosphatase activation C-term-domain-containing protein [Fennellomyces sp. T-0311]